MGLLHGRVALITGGAKGIGAATVRRFLAEGCRVVFTDLDEKAGISLAGELGKSVAFLCADHCNPQHNSDAVKLVLTRFGALHILFNNAGVICQGPTSEMDLLVVQNTIATNLLGPILMTQAALPALRASEGSDRSILFTGSVQSLIARPTFAVYGATKHAIAGLAGSLALELAPEGIRVNAVCPGPVDTDVFRDGTRHLNSPVIAGTQKQAISVPIGRMIEATEVADAALFLVSNAATALTGVLLPVDGGISAH